MTGNGQHLLLPLTRLGGQPKKVFQLSDDSLLAWGARVSEALEACVLVDTGRHIAAMSKGCGTLLGLDPAQCVGKLMFDLVTMVDFSAESSPIIDAETQSPMRRVLSSGRPARGLVRVRSGECISTYDVVAVPLAGGVGALAFLTEV